jgi:hypothetical protein
MVPVIAVASVAQKSAQRAQVHAIKARARGDRGTYALLWHAAMQLASFADGWRLGLADDASTGDEVLAAV